MYLSDLIQLKRPARVQVETGGLVAAITSQIGRQNIGELTINIAVSIQDTPYPVSAALCDRGRGFPPAGGLILPPGSPVSKILAGSLPQAEPTPAAAR